MVGGQVEDTLGSTQQEQRVVREQFIDHVGGGGSNLDGAARRDLGADALAFKLCEATYGSSREACYCWSQPRTGVTRTPANGDE